jgi:hypothetical protein
MQAAGMISHPGEMADFIEKAANELSWPDAAIPRWLSLELG